MTHATRLRLLAALLLAALPPGAAAGADHSLSLEEAVARALRRNESLIIERESVTAARAAVRGARGAYDPVLELDGTWHRATVPQNGLPGSTLEDIAPEIEGADAGATLRQLLPTGGELALRARGGSEETESGVALLSPAYGSRAGVELRQPLLRDLSIDAARLSVRVAQAGRKGAEASLRRTRDETVARVEQSYWRLVAARLGVQVLDQSVRLAEEQLEETRARVESGAAPGTELAQPRAELERRRGERLAARERSARAENTLKLLILGDAEEELWASTLSPSDTVVVDEVRVDAESAVRQALERRPELELFRAFLDRRQVESAYARDRRRPRLDAVASYDRFGLAGSRNPAGSGDPLPAGLDGDLDRSLDQLSDGDFDAARLALVVELPIVNRAARAEAEAAMSRERQAEAELQRARKVVRAEVLDAVAALETARQRIEAARAGREAAEIQLDAEGDRYASGLSTNFLVLTRQNDLSRARLDEISALTDYRTARAEMARATGTLAADRGLDLDGTGR